MKAKVTRRRALVLSGVNLLFVLTACVQTAPIFDDSPGHHNGMGGENPMASGATRASGATAGSGGTASGAQNSGGRPLDTGGAQTAGGAAGATNLGGAMLLPGPSGQSVKVSAGDRHSCAVVDGDLYCWGDNDFGALGLGDETSRLSPTRIPQALSYDTVECGASFTCGLAEQSVYCWGANSSGQLGSGGFTPLTEASRVTLQGPVRRLSVGHTHVCVIQSDGTLWCWGNNTEGQLAQNDPFPNPGVNSATPQQVGTDEDWMTVSAGDGHTCAIKTGGELYCWGRNTRGELGLGEEAAGQLRSPQRVGENRDWVELATGQHHTCAVRQDRSLACWGLNAAGQLGLIGDGPFFEPTDVPGTSSIAHIATNTFHTCTIDESGAMHCYGRNDEGQLGDGTTNDAPSGTVPLPEVTWESVAAGRFHSCAVRNEAIFCTGKNDDGRVGTGDRERRKVLSATRTSN